jgi:hypothetical protein
MRTALVTALSAVLLCGLCGCGKKTNAKPKDTQSGGDGGGGDSSGRGDRNTDRSRPQDPVSRTRMANDLRMLGLAYQNYCDANVGKGPARAEDLAPYIENDQRILGQLKSGDIVFNYGVGLLQVVNTTGTSNTILAYDKDTPTRGGYAVFFDGMPKRLTPDEFKAAAQPPKK